MLKKGDKGPDVVSLQRDLNDVDMLAEDGVFGAWTENQVRLYQETRGLKVDGVVGPATQEALDYELGRGEPEEHPLPEITSKWGYDHVPLVYNLPDPHFEAVTGTGSVESGLVRLVGGYTDRGNWSRGPDSLISLDLYSVGFAHWWSETAPVLLQKMAQKRMDLAEYAWGRDAAASIAEDPSWLRTTVGIERGKMPLKEEVKWLAAGWYQIARHPELVEVQVKHWLDRYAVGALEYHRELEWGTNRSLAALARHNNSGSMKRNFEKALNELGRDANELDVCALVYTDPDLYDHPERWDRILSMPEFGGHVVAQIDAGTLDYSVPPVRVDGTVPTFGGLL